MKGIDVSYHNGIVNWQAVKDAGMDFAICRTGYGKSGLDDTFQHNVEGAHKVGLQVGAYHFSYALTQSDAVNEALFCRKIIDDSGVFLELPVFFDMEEDDQTNYKLKHGFKFEKRHVTNLCKAFLENIGLNAGIYASYSWLEDLIDWKTLHEKYKCPIWNAQYSNNDYLQSYMWQFTKDYEINGKTFDANIIYDDKHKAGLNPWN